MNLHFPTGNKEDCYIISNNLTAKQKKIIKETAVSSGYIPDIKVTKVDGLKYGYADFKGAGVVKETVELPKESKRQIIGIY